MPTLPKCDLLFYLFIIFPKIVKKIHFIDNEKGIPHYKFAPLDYGYSGVYIKKCKVTGNPTLLIASCFCLKVCMSKMIEIDLDRWPIWGVGGGRNCLKWVIISSLSDGSLSGAAYHVVHLEQWGLRVFEIICCRGGGRWKTSKEWFGFNLQLMTSPIPPKKAPSPNIFFWMELIQKGTACTYRISYIQCFRYDTHSLW